MTRQQILADAVRNSGVLFARYFKAFDETNYTRQAPSLPNHLAWTLGHLALVLSRTTEKVNGSPIPESDFVKGGGQSGTRDRWDTEMVAFGSTPVDDPSKYPSFARCMQIFESANERCAAAFESASDAQIDATTMWGNAETPVWRLAGRMAYHNGTHCGQIADLRRALNMGFVLR